MRLVNNVRTYTRVRAEPSRTCTWSPINVLYPGEGPPFGDDDLRPLRSSGDILFLRIFTSRYITYRLRAPAGLALCFGAPDRKGSGRFSHRGYARRASYL